MAKLPNTICLGQHRRIWSYPADGLSELSVVANVWANLIQHVLRQNNKWRDVLSLCSCLMSLCLRPTLRHFSDNVNLVSLMKGFWNSSVDLSPTKGWLLSSIKKCLKRKVKGLNVFKKVVIWLFLHDCNGNTKLQLLIKKKLLQEKQYTLSVSM